MSEAPTKSKIILLTGFLGAGKTSLLNKAVKYFLPAKIGILVNDFGDIGVDGQLVKSQAQDLEVREINGGSIFCACLKSSFVTGLRAFADIRPDYLFIEGSGLSDPSAMTQILEDNKLDHIFSIYCTVCLLDPLKTHKLIKVLPVIAAQIKAADCLVITKSDLANQAELNKSQKTAVAINPLARFLFADHGQTDFAAFKPTRNRIAGDLQSCEDPQNRAVTLRLRVDSGLSVGQLNSQLKPLIPYFLRLKGFISLDEGDFYVSNNGRTLDFTPQKIPKDQPDGLVALCQPENKQKIVSLWQKKLKKVKT